MVLNSEDYVHLKSLFLEFVQSNAINEKFASLIALQGDASTRQYFRIYSDKKSYICCIDPLFVSSNESYNFSKMTFYLKSIGVNVPEILFESVAANALILQDLGDCLLQNYLSQIDFEEQELFIYKRCIDSMFSWNSLERGASLTPFGGLQFDKSKFMSEMEMTNENFIKIYLGEKNINSQLVEMNNFFSDLIDEILKAPYVFTHRDFHSRNIMIHSEGQQYVIDYQDARWGPLTYDLVSLLEDTYYPIELHNKEKLLEYYWNKLGKKKYENEKNFLREYNLVAIQRIYKVIGSFAYIGQKKSTQRYDRYIGQNIEKLKSILFQYPEFNSIRKLIMGFYYGK